MKALLLIVLVLLTGCAMIERAIRHEIQKEKQEDVVDALQTPGAQTVIDTRADARIDARLDASPLVMLYRWARRHALWLAGAVGSILTGLGIGGGAKVKRVILAILSERKAASNEQVKAPS